MASTYHGVAAGEMLEEKLVDVGKRLAKLPSSTSELQLLLEEAEDVLLFVYQHPPQPMADALAPTKKALLRDELLQHTDVNIRMIYASCMNEITRIALPEAPYDEGQMKKIFQLFMFALKELSNVTEGVAETPNDITAQRILLFMSKLKTCLIVLDLECNEIVVDMFQLFFNIIRSDHPASIFENMATVLTMMIEEMDNIPSELVETLLSSIRLDNKEASPQSWELGKIVFEKCASKLQACVREAVEAKDLDTKEYADIVSSLCSDAQDGNNAVAEVDPTTVDLSCKDTSRAERISMEGLMDRGAEVMHANQNMLEDEDTLEALQCHEQIMQLRNVETKSDTPVAENSVAEPQLEIGPQMEIDDVTTRRKRCRKPNTLMRPEEGYSHIWAIGGQVSYEVSGDVNKEMMDLPASLETGTGDIPGSSSCKELDSVDEAGTCMRGQSGNEESAVNQQGELDKMGKLSVSKPAEDHGPESLIPEKEKIVQLKADDARSGKSTAKNSEAAVQSEIYKETTRSRRVRRPNTLISPEEGYKHIWAMGGRSYKISGGVKKEKDLASPSEARKTEVPCSSSGKEVDSVEEAHHTEGQSVDTERELNQQSDQELPSRQKRKTVQSTVKERGPNTGPKQRRRGAAGQSAARLENEEVGHGNNDSQGEDVQMLRGLLGRRSNKDGNTSHKHHKEDVAGKMGGSVSKPAEDDDPESSIPEKEKNSSRSTGEYGEELVNSRVMVWWPLDKAFYTGTVVSYDPALKEHKVIYDDDEEEVLNLKNEKWELFSEDRTVQMQAECPSHAKQPTKMKRKTTQRGGSSRKWAAASSSKRSRSEGRSTDKNEVQASSESSDESSGTYFS